MNILAVALLCHSTSAAHCTPGSWVERQDEMSLMQLQTLVKHGAKKVLSVEAESETVPADAEGGDIGKASRVMMTTMTTAKHQPSMMVLETSAKHQPSTNSTAVCSKNFYSETTDRDGDHLYKLKSIDMAAFGITASTMIVKKGIQKGLLKPVVIPANEKRGTKATTVPEVLEDNGMPREHHILELETVSPQLYILWDFERGLDLTRTGYWRMIACKGQAEEERVAWDLWYVQEPQGYKLPMTSCTETPFLPFAFAHSGHTDRTRRGDIDSSPSGHREDKYHLVRNNCQHFAEKRYDLLE